MTADRPRVLIGVPTAGGAGGLARLLDTLAAQGNAADRVEIAVVDNGADGGDEVRGVVDHAVQRHGLPATYLSEPERGIPFVRNTCVQTALDRGSDALVFIDDDEWPASGWLDALLTTWRRTGADVVLGPAHAVLPPDAPRWARGSGVFDKDRGLADGAPIRTAYSYNTLVSRRALQALGPSFDTVFRHTGSSDHHYFKQATAAGLRSVWSPNAVVYEEIAPDRLRLSWVFKRGYRIGAGVTRSTRLRLGGVRGVARIALLTTANLARTAWQLLRSLRTHYAWVEGLRRFGIALGLLGGNIHHYEEYGRPGRP